MAPFLLSSCLVNHALQSIPALLEHPSDETRLILERAIGNLLNSQPIKLASNVFSQNSTVMIERNRATNNRLNSLETSDVIDVKPANTFSLFIKDKKCFLRHEQIGSIKLLDNISCKANYSSLDE